MFAAKTSCDAVHRFLAWQPVLSTTRSALGAALLYPAVASLHPCILDCISAASRIEQPNQVRHAGELLQIPAPGEDLVGLRLAVRGSTTRRNFASTSASVIGLPAWPRGNSTSFDQLPPVGQRDRDPVRDARRVARRRASSSWCTFTLPVNATSFGSVKCASSNVVEVTSPSCSAAAVQYGRLWSAVSRVFGAHASGYLPMML